MGPLEHLITLIQDYGYVIVFLGTLLEGETIVVLAGFLAYQGDLLLTPVILIAIVGSVIGDQSFFYFGRLKGTKFLSTRPRLRAKAERLHQLVERHQNWLMVGSRFMYGFRALLPITFGTSNVKRGKYLLLDLLGAILWALFFGFGGYLFGNALEHIVGRVHRAEKFIVLGIIIGVVVVQVIGFMQRRIADRIEEDATKPQDDV